MTRGPTGKAAQGTKLPITGRIDNSIEGLSFQRPSAQMFLALPDKIQTIPRLLTADDLMPLVASLPDSERIRLLKWIASPHGTDASVYKVAPPTDDEFSGDDEPLAWEAVGWEEFH